LAGKLSALIEEAATLDYALLNDQDFCALSEVAERLKNPRAALNYACLGFQRSASVKAGIALVRCYCAADDLAAAEQVAMKTTAANVNDEKAYIVHDILAHYCRKTGQLEKACAHMERTISLIMQHADKGVFYVDHLQACLDKFKDLVTATDMSADATLSMNTWRAKAVSQRDEALIRVAVGPRGELLPTDADLSAMRLHTQALVVLTEACASADVEGVLVGWLGTLHLINWTTTRRAQWRNEIVSVLDMVDRSLSTEFSGRDMLIEIEKLLSQCEPSATLEGLGESDVKSLLDRLRAAKSAVTQHQHLQSLVGRQVLSPEVLRELNLQSATGGVVLHILNPLDPKVRRGIDSLRFAQSAGASEKRVEMRFLSIRSGLRWDENTRRVLHSASATLADEYDAIAIWRRAVGIPGSVYVIEKTSPELKPMRIELFPVSLIVNAEGRLIFALSGANRFIANRVVASALNVQ